MAHAEIMAGICGFVTRVAARMDDEECVLTIEGDCTNIRRLAAELKRVEPLREITFAGQGPLTHQLAARCRLHAACPVPSGIIKAVEVAAGLALPADASIKVEHSE